MKVRPCISGLLAGLLALITLIPSAQAADLSVSPRPVPPINTASRESVSDAYNNFFLPLVEQVNTNGIGWTGSVANCLAGSTNDIGRTMTLEAINYFRAMTGLGALAENTTFTSQAQLAALYLAANPQRGLPSDHVLSPDGACYSAAGAEAALNANLAQGVVGPEAVAAFIRDDTGTASQANRSRVGHRRWLLDPGQTEIGLAGAMADDEPATGFTVLRIDPQADPSSSSSQRFPNQGYFPAELLSPTTAWSYSLGRADFSAATVSVTHNGQAVAVNQKPVSNGAGANTLVWELADFATPVGLAQDRYQVSITGISGGARS
ncbi:MAG: CAP domain-containing protein, partial [Bifidobacteriaceae bacterium]|nr:CAP domain-containing protein [Bifidobacteriaceae bacterium]